MTTLQLRMLHPLASALPVLLAAAVSCSRRQMLAIAVRACQRACRLHDRSVPEPNLLPATRLVADEFAALVAKAERG